MDIALLFISIIGLMLIGVPIAISLGISSTVFLVFYSGGSLLSISQTLFSAFQGHYTLLAIPFFILASSFMSTGGIAKRIIHFTNASVGHFSGGLAIAIGFGLYDFCGIVRVFSCNCHFSWLYHNCRNGEIWLHKRVCCGSDL